jgi:serine phosphatase RsbU (regulator of sigma subunit)/CBS domain-containing protein
MPTNGFPGSPAAGPAGEESLQPTVGEITTGDPTFAPPQTPVTEAAALMDRRNVGAIAVCRDGAVVGILTERDILRAVARGQRPGHATLGELMTPAPVTIPPDATWSAAADLMLCHGVRHLPVVEAGRFVGMLSMRNLMEHRSHQLEWLVGERTAELARKNAALKERDRVMQVHLEMAGRIQRQLLPAVAPQMPPLALALAYHPLDRVSGDYYDFAELPSDRLGILVADAAGHSVPAAFVSVMAKTAFQAYAQGLESPAAVLRTMNHRLADLMTAGYFITMFYGVVDRRTLRLVYSLAGHPRPLWYRRATGVVEELDAEGPVVGMLPEARFEERTAQLAPGDLVLVYTDGVTECRNPQDEQFGPQRLKAFLAAQGGQAEAAVARLDAELVKFRAGQPFRDDVTCIGLAVRP